MLGKCWDSKLYLALQNPVILPTVPWEPLEFLTNICEIIRKFMARLIRTRIYCLSTFCSNFTAETVYSVIKIFGENTLKKATLPIEFFLESMWRKIIISNYSERQKFNWTI